MARRTNINWHIDKVSGRRSNNNEDICSLWSWSCYQSQANAIFNINTYVYLYIYVYVCVCLMCVVFELRSAVRPLLWLDCSFFISTFLWPIVNKRIRILKFVINLGLTVYSLFFLPLITQKFHNIFIRLFALTNIFSFYKCVTK